MSLAPSDIHLAVKIYNDGVVVVKQDGSEATQIWDTTNLQNISPVCPAIVEGGEVNCRTCTKVCEVMQSITGEAVTRLRNLSILTQPLSTLPVRASKIDLPLKSRSK